MGNVWSGNTKSWEHVTKYEHFEEGDELCYFDFPRYRWGIVTQKETCGHFYLVGFHLKVIDGIVRREKYNFHMDDCNYQKASYKSFQLSNAEAVRNALSRLGEDEYDRLTNFARAFTRWCKTGARDILSRRHEIRSKEQVTLRELEKYDHVVLFIQNHYHHGIVMSTDPAYHKLTLVHYSDVTVDGSGQYKAYKSTLRYRTGPLLRLKYSKSDSKRNIQKRTDACVDSKTWKDETDTELTGTCEQFASWIITGKKVATQVKLSDEIAKYEASEDGHKGGAQTKPKVKHSVSMPDGVKRQPMSTIKEFTKTRLAKVVGMENLKRQLSDFTDSLIADAARQKKGIDVKRKRPVLVFQGNPGTGKTSIAYLVAEILFHCGLVDTSALKTVQRPDLVAQYIGQTAVQTNECIDEARGGTMLIDEAYQLNRQGNDFGVEAIETIMATIEGGDKTTDDRPAYIFAGYTDRMKAFLQANEGLLRRITYTFQFDNYTPQELAQIFEIKIKDGGFIFEGQTEWLSEQINHRFTEAERNSVNAGLCNDLVQFAKTSLDRRAAQAWQCEDDIDVDVLQVFTKGDIETAMEEAKRKLESHQDSV